LALNLVNIFNLFGGLISDLLLVLFSFVVFPALLLRREFTKKPQHLGLTLGVFGRVSDQILVYS